MSPKTSNVLAYSEDICHQIKKSKLYYDDYAKLNIKNALRYFPFNLADVDYKNIFRNSKTLKIIKALRKSLVILKPDEGNAIILLNQEDYTKSMECFFNNQNKFKELDCDATLTRLITLQIYLRKLKNNVEITEVEFEFKAMRPKKPARLRSLVYQGQIKNYIIYYHFDRIIYTNGSEHYLLAKVLAKLLKTLTTNEISLDDSFDVAEKINNIPKELLSLGYKYLSFNVESLFTNVPPRKAVNIILERVYNDKLLQTSLKNDLEETFT